MRPKASVPRYSYHATPPCGIHNARASRNAIYRTCEKNSSAYIRRVFSSHHRVVGPASRHVGDDDLRQRSPRKHKRLLVFLRQRGIACSRHRLRRGHSPAEAIRSYGFCCCWWLCRSPSLAMGDTRLSMGTVKKWRGEKRTLRPVDSCGFLRSVEEGDSEVLLFY